MEEVAETIPQLMGRDEVCVVVGVEKTCSKQEEMCVLSTRNRGSKKREEVGTSERSARKEKSHL